MEQVCEKKRKKEMKGRRKRLKAGKELKQWSEYLNKN